MSHEKRTSEIVSASSGEREAAAVTRFPDLRSAGSELATRLSAYRSRDDVIVLGIVLGGVLVADEVATYLGAPLDFLIIRRLLVRGGPERQDCAVSVAGALVIDEELVAGATAPSSPLDYFIADALAGIAARERICRRNRSALDVSGRTVVLVDCGIRSGSTMRAAIGALRTKSPAAIVAAVPVASRDGYAAVKSLADELVCLAQPDPFPHVAYWYKDFNRPADELIGDYLQAHKPGSEDGAHD
jgi:predicted phosphoribosyltransferase